MEPGYAPPREDINAPDLYIPGTPSFGKIVNLVMAFVTYILLSAFLSGVQGHFSPENFRLLHLMPSQLYFLRLWLSSWDVISLASEGKDKFLIWLLMEGINLWVLLLLFWFDWLGYCGGERENMVGIGGLNGVCLFTVFSVWGSLWYFLCDVADDSYDR